MMQREQCPSCGKARSKDLIYFKGNHYCNRCLHRGKVGTKMPLKQDKEICACGEPMGAKSRRCLPCSNKLRGSDGEKKLKSKQLSRPCKRCEQKFTPNGKYNRICNDCDKSLRKNKNGK